jgi:hypothetical protein
MNTILTQRTEKLMVKQFAEAVSSMRMDLLDELLNEDGCFHFINSEEETEEGSKNQFMEWFSKEVDSYGKYLKENAKIEYEFDQCLHCKIGAATVLFEDGLFPVTLTGHYEKQKTGFMLEFKDDGISDISFCYTFLKTENKYRFECE